MCSHYTSHPAKGRRGCQIGGPGGHGLVWVLPLDPGSPAQSPWPLPCASPALLVQPTGVCALQGAASCQARWWWRQGAGWQAPAHTQTVQECGSAAGCWPAVQQQERRCLCGRGLLLKVSGRSPLHSNCVVGAAGVAMAAAYVLLTGPVWYPVLPFAGHAVHDTNTYRLPRGGWRCGDVALSGGLLGGRNCSNAGRVACCLTHAERSGLVVGAFRLAASACNNQQQPCMCWVLMPACTFVPHAGPNHPSVCVVVPLAPLLLTPVASECVELHASLRRSPVACHGVAVCRTR